VALLRDPRRATNPTRCWSGVGAEPVVTAGWTRPRTSSRPRRSRGGGLVGCSPNQRCGRPPVRCAADPGLLGGLAPHRDQQPGAVDQQLVRRL